MSIDAIAQTPVAAIPQRRPVVVPPDLALGEVIQRIAVAGRGHAIIVDAAGRAVGIFTERDLLTRVDPAAPGWSDTPIRDLMTADIVTVTSDASLADCITALLSRRFRSLPVVDDGRPVGVVSIRDILRHVAEVFPADFLCLPPDPGLEAKEQWGG